MSKKRYEWKCPKCGAIPNECGKGYCLNGGNCEGFLCECDSWDDNEDPEHGHYLDKPCQNAFCYHCGWYGEFPPVDKRPKMIAKIKKKLESQDCKDSEKTAKYLIKYIMEQMR